MTQEVKKKCIEYFERIGGIESVKPKYRFRLKKAVVALYTDLYESGIFEKMMDIIPTYPPGHYRTEKYRLKK